MNHTDMPWFKMWGKEYFRGDTRKALRPEERSVMLDLMCMASISYKKGTVAIGDGVPYPMESLARLFGVSPSVLKSTISKLVSLESVSVDSGGIHFNNWIKYQRGDWDGTLPSQKGSRGVGEEQIGVLLGVLLGDRKGLLSSVSVNMSSVSTKELKEFEPIDSVELYRIAFNHRPSALTQSAMVYLIRKHGKGRFNYAVVAAGKNGWRFGMVEKILRGEVDSKPGGRRPHDEAPSHAKDKGKGF